MAVFFCFAGALSNLFVWDDWVFIVRAAGFRGFDARHLRWMFTTTRMGDYTPLAWLSYAVDYEVWGLNPAGYHLTNVILHALNAVLFYRLAGLLLRSIFSEEAPKTLEIGAIVAALAFAAHPLRVESVAWASERRDVLAGAFSLSTLLLYAKAAARRDPRSASRLRALSAACFAGAALSKATVVPLPAALLALDFYPLRRLGAGENPRERRSRLVEKIPFAAISAAAAAMAVRAQFVSGNLTAAADHGWPSRLAQALYGAGFYVRETLLPAGLCALYPLSEYRGLLARPALESAATIAALIWTFSALGVPRKAQASLWGYYLAMLLPVLGLMQNGPQLVALRYSYLSCLGWALLAGCAAIRAFRSRKKLFAGNAAALAAMSLWLGSNVWAVQTQIGLWRSGRSLWESVLRRYPLSPDANVNMAGALLQENEPRDAEAYALSALRRSPDDPNALLTLARILLAENRPAEAMAPLARAAALLPGSAEAQSNAGSILALHGRFAEAIPYFEKAARIEPENPSYSGQLNHARHDLRPTESAE